MGMMGMAQRLVLQRLDDMESSQRYD